jgi:hypothetical protein
MKNTIISLILAVSLLALPGCAFFENVSRPGQTVQSYLPYIEPTVAIAASAVFSIATSGTDRVKKAQIVYNVAVVVEALSKGASLTPEQFEALLSESMPKKEQWASFAVSISSVYSSVYYRVNGDAKVALDTLAAIASGLKRAAQPYIPSFKEVVEPVSASN